MNFLRNLFGRKRKGADDALNDSLQQSYRDTIGSVVDEGSDDAVSDILTSINSKVNRPEQAADANMWDAPDAQASSALPDTAPPAPEATRAPARSRRAAKTRLIGFDKSDGEVVDLFDDAPKAAAAKGSKFPVGWLTVTEGPGRGESFGLVAGMSQIGRNEDQAVQLDFGDNSISRTNHAAIVYDPEKVEFLLGHGGKSNIVRLNDKPLISNEELKSGDVIRIGETVLRFVAMCDESFNWSVEDPEEDDEDVAIA